MKNELTKEEIIDFLNNYEFDCKESNDGKTYEIFTLATQWTRGFPSRWKAIEHCIEFIKKNDYKPDETSFNRFIRHLENGVIKL